MPIRNANASDLARVRALLEVARLPVEDLEAERISFLVAEGAGGFEGVVGLQAFADAGLLRSLAVEPRVRGQGLGQRLVAAAEDQARAAGVDQLFLLTLTAESFFRRLGYRRVERGSVPASIQATAEFASICPASAACMARRIG